MKNILYLVLLMTLSCNFQSKQSEKKQIKKTKEDAVTKKEAPNSKYYTTKDTVLICTEKGDTLKYTKQEYNTIVDKHPEFFEEYPNQPDQSYFNLNNSEEFSSEVGQDCYYVLYAYFLKQKNGNDKYAQQRKKLIDIYSNINTLFGTIQNGGSYFGHQEMRILGYAEYSIYLLPKEKNDIQKTYAISKQKNLYLKSLRQLIEDECYTLGKEKLERIKKLNEFVNELDKLITDHFYLRRAQEFQYEHYEFY